MGISTVGSYTMAQIFEAVGLSQDLVDEYFTGTSCPLGGVGIDVLAEEVAMRHRRAYPDNPTERAHRRLETGGEYQWRREGEVHLFNPETVFLLNATRSRQYDVFEQYTRTVDDLAEGGHPAGLFALGTSVRKPVPLDEVEPVNEIVKRFNTGAMSYGSISAEAHQTLAIAMNRLGGRSNTGEGGEDPDRFTPDPNGDLRRSAIKQVASGRFRRDERVPGQRRRHPDQDGAGRQARRGGQLPGGKVYPWVARTRHSTPRRRPDQPAAAPRYLLDRGPSSSSSTTSRTPTTRRGSTSSWSARSGSAPSRPGSARRTRTSILISGHDGGTGAAPLTSLKHADSPWELGLAETQQPCSPTASGPDRRPGRRPDEDQRDVIVAALLGAEEFGFATAPLVVSGCVMMRVCHLDTCPVGVATQNPELRKRFTGQPEFVVTFFEFLAEQVRTYLAELGFRSIGEAVGHAELLLDTRKTVGHWKARAWTSPMLVVPELPVGAPLRQVKGQDHGLNDVGQTLIQLCEGALLDARPVTLELPVRNVNAPSAPCSARWSPAASVARGCRTARSTRSSGSAAGQSFGAFLPRGITMRLFGDANDYVSKGLSGGRIVVRPSREAPFAAEDNVIAGNVIGYGATGGEIFLRGRAGERFCVRNSARSPWWRAWVTTRSEYMTGGRAVILGRPGGTSPRACPGASATCSTCPGTG